MAFATFHTTVSALQSYRLPDSNQHGAVGNTFVSFGHKRKKEGIDYGTMFFVFVII
jgi:hypothetical protein